MTNRKVVVLPARNCRRSRRIIEYLEEQGVPFTRIPLESPEGQALAEQHDLRASPGILVNGESVNPFDLLIQPACRIDAAAVEAIFGDKA